MVSVERLMQSQKVLVEDLFELKKSEKVKSKFKAKQKYKSTEYYKVSILGVSILYACD